jgi:hypothetical protein
MSVVFNQEAEQVEGFGLKWNVFAIAQQYSLGAVHSERAEFVDVVWLVAHNRTPGTVAMTAPEISLKFP